MCCIRWNALPAGVNCIDSAQKGRRKQTIQYYVVRKVPKAARDIIRHEVIVRISVCVCVRARGYTAAGCNLQMLNQVEILHGLHCNNIIQFYEWFETRNHMWLIMEYCTGASLYELLLQVSCVRIELLVGRGWGQGLFIGAP